MASEQERHSGCVQVAQKRGGEGAGPFVIQCTALDALVLENCPHIEAKFVMRLRPVLTQRQQRFVDDVAAP